MNILTRTRPTVPGWYAFSRDGGDSWTAVRICLCGPADDTYLEWDPAVTLTDCYDRPLPLLDEAEGIWIPINFEEAVMGDRLTITKVCGGWTIEAANGTRWVATTPARLAAVVKLWAQAASLVTDEEVA